MTTDANQTSPILVLLRTGCIGPIVLMMLSSFVGGCSANSSAVFKTFAVEHGQSVSLDAKQRAILVNRYYDENGDLRTTYCAEPSPDALSTIGASFGFGTQLTLPGGEQGNAELARTIASATSDALSARNATIQLLRDGLYRACEAHAAGALSSLEYAQVTGRYQNIMLALLTIELLANLNRPQRPPTILTSNADVDLNSIGEKIDPNKEPTKLSPNLINASVPDATSIPSNDSSNQQQVFYSDTSIKDIALTAQDLVFQVLRSEDRVSQCLRYMALAAERQAAQARATRELAAIAGNLAEITARTLTKTADMPTTAERREVLVSEDFIERRSRIEEVCTELIVQGIRKEVPKETSVR